MTDTPCVVCTRRPPRDGWTVCDGCAGRLDDNLARIAELTRLAAAWLAPRSSHGNGVRSVPGSKPPLDTGALDVALGLGGGVCDPAPQDVPDEPQKRTGGPYRPAWLRSGNPAPRDGRVDRTLPVLETLASWERLVREHFHFAWYGVATEHRGDWTTDRAVMSSCGFLSAQTAVIAVDPTFPVEDYAREVADLRWSLERLDPDRDRPGLRIPCPSPHRDGDGRACGYRIVVDATRMADDLPCPRCDTTWSGNRLVLVALNDPGVTIWAYPDVIADTLSIPPRTLRDWAAKGFVTRMGSRYDVGAAFRRKIGEAA